MGRPRRHDEQTAKRLLDAAESIVEAEGPSALTVRRVAEVSGTTTRAVYSVFGTMNGLVVGLAVRAFDLLYEGVTGVPETEDPVADVVLAGTSVFRRLVTDHPSLYRIAIQRAIPEPNLVAGFRDAAARGLDALRSRFARLEAADLLGGRSTADAALEFHALCEGLGGLELRGLLPSGSEERIWREALGALVYGFRVR
jgi:AcrR family transcriptional regulator